MALRMIELFLPRDHAERLSESFKETDFEIHGMWTEELDDNKKLVRVLVTTGGTEAVIDEFEKRFSWLKDFRVVLLPAEATLPRLANKAEPLIPGRDVGRVTREELYTDVQETARVTRVYAAMVVLSTVVAAVGLIRDSSVIVLSAMVIAPLLGPNMALALATTLGDRELGRTAIKSAVVGFAIAMLASIALGIIVPFNVNALEISSRTQVGLADIALALAAGAAGAISVTAGSGATLIGVMVAVALLPPTVVTGMLIGKGKWALALGAAELLAINLVCLNLAAVLTFLVRGVRPSRWWEAQAAKRATKRAIIAWAVLLLILFVLVLIQIA